MKKKHALDIFLHLVAVVLGIVIIFPLFWVFLSSFKESADILRFPPRVFPGAFRTLEQYRIMLSRLPMLTYLKNTLIFAVGASVLEILFDSMAGYALARFQFKGKGIITSLILSAMMLPFVITMLPLYVEEFKFGLLDTYAGLIIPRAASAYGIFMMRSFFITMPKDLEEAARVDGMNEFLIYAKIMMPLCKPAIITLFIFNLTACWNDLLYPLLLTSSSQMRTISSGLAMFVGSRVNEYGPAMAATVAALLPLFIVFLFSQRFFVEGIAVTGMKE